MRHCTSSWTSMQQCTEDNVILYCDPATVLQQTTKAIFASSLCTEKKDLLDSIKWGHLIFFYLIN